MCKAWVFTGITCAAREVIAKAFTACGGGFTHVLRVWGQWADVGRGATAHRKCSWQAAGGEETRAGFTSAVRG